MDRLSSLDGLRALAALLVLAFHARLPFFPGGYIGVDIFFVLSGYLITGNLLREYGPFGEISLWRFWGRRLARLYPALLLMLAVLWAVAPQAFAPRELIAAGLYLSNIAISVFHQPMMMLGHTWSLAVEMHFYLLWPFVVMFLCARDHSRAILALVALYVGATVWRMVLFDDQGWVRTYYALDSHASGLVLGSLLSVLKWRPDPAVSGKLGMAALGALAVFVYQFRFGDTAAAGWGGLFAELATAALIMALLSPGTRFARAFAHPASVRIGLWSYSLYLWHYPVAVVARESLPGVESFIVTLAISMILAALSYELLEKPAIRWLQTRFFPSPRLAAPAR